ncbi:hypothetical protein [Cohnella sp. GCM10027633]|uniref:hypothetical protein n=1 Tax=unclassified Cohnella TaxID=2636738 RepID=UPI003640D6A1
MKTSFVVLQIVYALGLIPWLFVWGLSFMSFDQGFGFANVAFVGTIGMYPVAAIVCSIFAWKLRKRKARAAAIVNLIPMAWILGVGGLIVY